MWSRRSSEYFTGRPVTFAPSAAVISARQFEKRAPKLPPEGYGTRFSLFEGMRSVAASPNENEVMLMLLQWIVISFDPGS